MYLCSPQKGTTCIMIPQCLIKQVTKWFTGSNVYILDHLRSETHTYIYKYIQYFQVPIEHQLYVLEPTSLTLEMSLGQMIDKKRDSSAVFKKFNGMPTSDTSEVGCWLGEWHVP